MQKMKLHSPDLTAQNIEKLAELFPSCVTDAVDESGTPIRAVDFDQLRQELSGAAVDGPRERFQLTWPGKRDATLIANSPIASTLRPLTSESLDFDSTKNLFIEGDNLDALKLLQETYLNKVKLIYIDPPYNTTNDFIYDDDFACDSSVYFERSNQVDDLGNRLLANPESNGARHSDWLTMMYSRLRLARNLLREDGVFFVSIGDDEQANLKKVCDEIFGLGNFLGCACRVSKKANNQGDFWSPNFDYILTYAKDKTRCPVFFGGVNYDAYDQVETEGPRSGEKYQLVRLYMTSLDPMRGCNNQRYYIEAPDGTLLIPPGNKFPEEKVDGGMCPPESGADKVWRWSQASYLANKDKIVVKSVRSSNLVGSDGGAVKWNVFTKTYLQDVIDNSTAKPNSLIEDHINQNSSHELGKLGIPFPFAKPSSLIKYLCEISKTGHDDIVLDFFAGSGTTAHAVLEHNAEGGHQCRFILVQLPEVLDPENRNHQEGFMFCQKNGFEPVISSITKERIRRVGKQVREEHTAGAVDVGFRVFKIDSSNMRDIYYSPDEVKKDDLLSQVDNIREDRTADDLLFQVLLDWGVDLSLPIAAEKLEGKTVYFVDGNALAACFEQGVSEKLVKEIAARHPLRVVFRDNGFASDAVKINVEQIFKLLSPETDVKSI